jgi:hypothetical protein
LALECEVLTDEVEGEGRLASKDERGVPWYRGVPKLEDIFSSLSCTWKNGGCDLEIRGLDGLDGTYMIGEFAHSQEPTGRKFRLGTESHVKSDLNRKEVWLSRIQQLWQRLPIMRPRQQNKADLVDRDRGNPIHQKVF